MASFSMKAMHPSGMSVLFDTRYGNFTLANGTRLRSVSKLLAPYFPFDADKVAQFVAQREGSTPEKVQQDWKRSVVLGKTVKQVCEAVWDGKAAPPLSGADPIQERLEADFRVAATQAATELMGSYQILARNLMVCSPSLGLGGSVDLLLKHKDSGRVMLADLKATTSKSSDFRFSDFDSPCVNPLGHLPATRGMRAALQLLLNGYLMRAEGYDTVFSALAGEARLEYGTVTIGKAADGAVAADFKAVVPSSVLPADDVGDDSTVDALLEHLIQRQA